MITPARGTHPDTEKPIAVALARRNLNVRYGSKAEMLRAVSDVRFVHPANLSAAVRSFVTFGSQT
jgi:hypothetical protein